MYNETPQQAARRLSAKLIQRGFKPIALHVYEDANGSSLYWRIRLKHPVTGEKWIRPLSCNEKGSFRLKEPHFVQGKPLYKLPHIVQNPNKTVWIVEGEACADQLIQLGLIATTSGSVDSVHTTDWLPLSRRNIIIWADHDEPGRQYAQHVTERLQSLHCEVLWVDVAALNLPPKGDCVDWLAQYPTAVASDVEALLKKRPTLIPLQSNENKHPTEQTLLFIVNQKGVYYSGNEELRWICSELKVKALVRDHASENWGRLLEFYDADGQLHTWAMPMEMLKGSGEELRGELLRLGLEIATGIKARNWLVEYITTAKTQARARCVTRTGWHFPLFVLPNATLGSTSEIVLYQSEQMICDYQQSGSLAEWQQAISRPCVGNSRLMLSVSCAFAAMLLGLIGAESGGINLVSESSTGKTTLLRVAASVYGAPDYLNRWRATANGLEALATLRSDTLLVLDELAQVDSKEAGEIAYMLANGSGKARASKQGYARSRNEWRLLFLSAGEISLGQHLQEAGKRVKAGQEVRLVDIPADAGKGLGVFETLHGYESPALFSKALMQATAHYYGKPARAFLEKLTAANLSELSDGIKELSKQFIAKHLPQNASGQVYRVCERFALIAAAGELASSYGITQWETGEAHEAIHQCFYDWLAQRGNVENQEKHTILSQIKRFFEAHGESRFTDINNQNSRTINRAGFKETDTHQDTTTYYVMSEIFREEICAGLNPKTVAHTLLAEGWLKPDANNAPYRRERLPGMGQVRCYVFTNTMWES